jgi:hypothetical protein
MPLNPQIAEEITRRIYPDRFAEWASGGKFIPYAYQRFFARKIAKAIAKGGGRLIINLPSRHGKSEMCSRWLPTWFLDNRPARNVILAAYGAELAERWGREVRNEFEQNEKLITKLRDDSKAANRWNTPQGGGMLAVGVGGSVVGFGGDLVIIDDPHKDWKEAKSPTFRKRVIEWFGSTLYSRLEPDATVVLLMQRLDTEDLAGYLIEQHKDAWEVVRLPAVAQANDPMGRLPGAALCPERYDEAALDKIRMGMTADAWEAMFQQNPESFGTGRTYHRFTPTDNEDKTLQLRPDLPLQLTFDFNVNPGCHLLVGQYDKRIDLFTVAHEIFGPRMKTRPAMDEFERLYKKLAAQGLKWTEAQIYGDRSGKTENTTTTLTDYHIICDKLREMGIKPAMRVPDANPPIKERVTTFNDALSDARGEVHYKVNPLQCPRLVADLKLMKDDEDGLPDKSDSNLSHPSDAEGYRVFAQRRIHRPERRKGEVILMSH